MHWAVSQVDFDAYFKGFTRGVPASQNAWEHWANAIRPYPKITHHLVGVNGIHPA